MAGEGRVIVIGITGMSCAGKTTLAASIAAHVTNVLRSHATCLSLDSYYRENLVLPKISVRDFPNGTEKVWNRE